MFPLEPAPEFNTDSMEVGGAGYFLNRLLQLSTDLIHLHDLRTQRILFVNSHLTEVLGYTPDDLAALGHSLASKVVEPVPADFVAFVAARFAGAADGETVEYELRIQHKNGSLRRLRTRGSVFRRDATGAALEILGISTDVTAEYDTATRLHEGENLNRRLLQILPDFITIYNTQTGQSRYVGINLREVLGYSEADVAQGGGSLRFAVETDRDLAEINQAAARLPTLAEGEFVGNVVNMRTKAGERLVVQMRTTVFSRLADGTVGEVLAVLSDVTEQEAQADKLRQLVQQLSRTEALLSQTEESLRFGSWEWDVASKTITWSQGLWRIFGYDAEGSQPVTLAIFLGHLHPDDTDQLRSLARRAFAQPAPFEFEYRITDAQGRLRTLAGRGVPLFDEAGTLLRLLGNTLDVTDERQASETLEKQTYLLREAEVLLSFGSWEWDLTTDRIVWSEGMYQILGYENDHRPALLTPGSMSQHHHPDEAADFAQRVQGIITEKRPFDFERRSLTLSGREIYVREKGTVLTNERGEATKLIGSTADVTELKKSQADLEHRIAELDRSNRDLEQFAYVASHDLQEPLRKITAFAERLQLKYADRLGSDGQLYVERIVDATQRMRVLMENLLNFSRMTRKAGAFEPTDLNAVARGVLSDLDLKIDEKEARVEVGKLSTVDALPGQMPQLLQNLIGNALKFAASDAPPLVRILSQHVSTADKIAHHLDLTRQYTQLTVEDNGIGFDPSFAEKIFVLFQRLHGRSEYEGTGIGLAICKKIVENHMGIIFAESQPGQGARFTVILPLSQANTERRNA